MLHQAARQLFCLLSAQRTQRFTPPEDMQEMFRFTEAFNPVVKKVSPRNSQAERELLNLLCAAHTEALYNDEYHISAKQLEELVHRLAQLADLAAEGKLVRDKIAWSTADCYSVNVWIQLASIMILHVVLDDRERRISSVIPNEVRPGNFNITVISNKLSYLFTKILHRCSG